MMRVAAHAAAKPSQPPPLLFVALPLALRLGLGFGLALSRLWLRLRLRPANHVRTPPHNSRENVSCAEVISHTKIRLHCFFIQHGDPRLLAIAVSSASCPALNPHVRCSGVGLSAFRTLPCDFSIRLLTRRWPSDLAEPQCGGAVRR